jgi:hypothetical protein
VHGGYFNTGRYYYLPEALKKIIFCLKNKKAPVRKLDRLLFEKDIS